MVKAKQRRQQGHLLVMMTLEERELLDMAATWVGVVSTGAWVRMLALKEARRVKREAET